MRSPVLLALAAVSCAAQDPIPPLVNLARLPITRVFAGGRNGGPDAEGFYGVRNAFDGGKNILNGINYSSWNADGPQGYVIVRFSQPVTVTGMLVEASSSYGMPAPENFTVQIRSNGAAELFLSPTVALDGLRTVYAPSRPIERVREVMLLFQAKTVFAVDEIEIYGPPPARVSLTPVTPPRDPDLARAASVENDSRAPAESALVRTLAAAQIAEMRRSRALADRVPDSAGKARAWLELNHAADQLSELLRNQEALKPLAEEANLTGVTVDWCEPGADWVAGTQGYEKYLEILPDGPQADDAWWMARLRNGPRCGDFEGSAEEYQELIRQYLDFLTRFPNSSRAPEARRRLEEAQAEYKAATAPR